MRRDQVDISTEGLIIHHYTAYLLLNTPVEYVPWNHYLLYILGQYNDSK